MNKSTLINLLKNASGVILGVGVHHFGGKILDRKENLAEYEAQVERDEISRELLENVKSVNNKFDNLTEIIEVKMNENIPIGADVATEIKNNIENIISTGNEIIETKSNDPNIGEKVSKILRSSEDIIKLIDQISKGGNNNNFISNLDIQGLYNYLDSLTLLEESAFLHLLIFIILLCSIANIISIFFGNEIIRYFNLEEKFPKLAIFFKIRNKLQRYYLMWNIFTMVLVCFVAIFINLLVLY